MAPKAKVKKMLDLRRLLQDDGLRAKILEARNQKEVAKILNTAGKSDGISFTSDWLNAVFVDVKSTRGPDTFTEQELMLLGNGPLEGDTAPKLCHTDSCGGGHAGCC